MAGAVKGSIPAQGVVDELASKHAHGLVDGVWINILMLVTSIPIITIGAARLPAMMLRRSIEGEGA